MRAVALAIFLTGLMIDRAIERAIEKKPINTIDAAVLVWGVSGFVICLIGGW